MFHIGAGSILPVAGIFVPWMAIVIGSGLVTLTSLSLDLARFRMPYLNRLFLRWLAPFLKNDETFKITGATYLLIATFLCFLAFDQTIAVTALLFLALGDPVAGLVGGRMPGPRVLGKSPGGAAAFVLVSLAVVAVLIASGVVQYHWALVAGAVIAALVELAPIPVDDNLTIPLVSGLFMNLLLMWT
ncbi:MAG: hypothetical protein IIB31_06955 [Chloroflexi bacterium]|nr:hypothetical protein [Chloroflexota bacterium]